MGSLLLVAGGVARLARVSSDAEGAPRFEICFDEAPSSAQLHRALGALSVVCLLFYREAQAIQDPQVARLFLAEDGDVDTRKIYGEKNHETGVALGRRTA